MNTPSDSVRLSVIEPGRGWQLLNLSELCEYRDLFFFLVWRNIKTLYAQTILGLAWAVLNPLIQIVMFTVIFGTVAKIPSEGMPYMLFSSVAIVPWAYMSQAITKSSQSLVDGQAMLGKIYFPRLIFPLAPVVSTLLDFAISLIILLVMLAAYRVKPTANLLFLPVFMVYMTLIPATIGLWLSSLSIRFRDVKFALPFAIRMLMYTAPIVYTVENVSRKNRLLYSLNPLVGVIEGFRACFLGRQIPWEYILPGMAATSLLLLAGIFYFKHTERVFADVI